MVNIDTVYQRVLALANKEQRGYITPQEFNLFANQAQYEIFEQYFYDISQFSRVSSNSTEYSDMLGFLDEKLGVFKKTGNFLVGTNTQGTFVTKPTDFYRVGSIYTDSVGYDGNSYSARFEEVDYKEYMQMSNSYLTKPTQKRPIYYIVDNMIILQPNQSGTVKMSYIRKLANVQWGYVVISDKAIWDANSSVDFELHKSEETELVYKILKLAGITLNKPGLSQSALNLEESKAQKEKQ